MTYRNRGPIWILCLALIQVSHQITVADDILRFLQKRPNIRELTGPNMVNVTWEAELPPEMNEFELCYNFSHRFMDKAEWKKEMLQNNYRSIILNMHPGFISLVSKALCQFDTIVLDGNTTEFIYFSPQVYITNVTCIIYNVRSVNCTWEWRDDTPDNVSYSFALRLYSRWFPCKHYIRNKRRNTGCHLKDVLKIPPYRIKAWFFNNLTNFSKAFTAQRIELLNPPVNISAMSMDKSTILEWLPPPSLNDLPPHCLQYNIKIEAETQDYFKNIPDIKKQDYVFFDIDKDKRYLIQIRAKPSSSCGESKYWGEWSQPLLIGQEKKVFPIWILILIVAAGSVVAITLLIYFCNRQVEKLCRVSIPDPSEKLKRSLFSNINSQNCISTYTEEPSAITELEIVTGLKDCQDASQQQCLAP